jgi:four helix bundle protein
MKYPFQDLRVWQKGMELVKEIYRLTKSFPKDEQYGMTSQLRRAAVSVPVNIAEGKGRFHQKEYIQFLYTARGSIYELITLIQVGEDLGYMIASQRENLLKDCDEIAAMIQGLIRYLK